MWSLRFCDPRFLLFSCSGSSDSWSNFMGLSDECQVRMIAGRLNILFWCFVVFDVTMRSWWPFLLVKVWLGYMRVSRAVGEFIIHRCWDFRSPVSSLPYLLQQSLQRDSAIDKKTQCLSEVLYGSSLGIGKIWCTHFDCGGNYILHLYAELCIAQSFGFLKSIFVGFLLSVEAYWWVLYAEELSWHLHGRFLQKLISTYTYARQSCHMLGLTGNYVRIGPSLYHNQKFQT